MLPRRASSDPRSESRAPLDEEIYVPCDERVGFASIPAPTLPPLGGHFRSLADVYRLFGLDDLGRLPEAKAVINSGAPFPVVPQVISGATAIMHGVMCSRERKGKKKELYVSIFLSVWCS